MFWRVGYRSLLWMISVLGLGTGVGFGGGGTGRALGEGVDRLHSSALISISIVRESALTLRSVVDKIHCQIRPVQPTTPPNNLLCSLPSNPSTKEPPIPQDLLQTINLFSGIQLDDPSQDSNSSL